MNQHLEKFLNIKINESLTKSVKLISDNEDGPMYTFLYVNKDKNVYKILSNISDLHQRYNSKQLYEQDSYDVKYYGFFLEPFVPIINVLNEFQDDKLYMIGFINNDLIYTTPGFIEMRYTLQ